MIFLIFRILAIARRINLQLPRFPPREKFIGIRGENECLERFILREQGL
jgi:hypothetical protein